jgi:hypothetical protein
MIDKEYSKTLLKTDYDPCNLCGMPMLASKCKITCLNCGFKRDCSDS